MTNITMVLLGKPREKRVTANNHATTQAHDGERGDTLDGAARELACMRLAAPQECRGLVECQERWWFIVHCSYRRRLTEAALTHRRWQADSAAS